jgi:hypothetical protein
LSGCFDLHEGDCTPEKKKSRDTEIKQRMKKDIDYESSEKYNKDVTVFNKVSIISHRLVGEWMYRFK